MTSEDLLRRRARQLAAEAAAAGDPALVVGCGVCADPVFLAGLGCEVTAFDVSPTAVAELYTVQALYGRRGPRRSGHSPAWWRRAARCW